MSLITVYLHQSIRSLMQKTANNLTVHKFKRSMDRSAQAEIKSTLG